MNIRIDYITYSFDGNKYSLDDIISDIKKCCNENLDNVIILIRLKDKYNLIAINSSDNSKVDLCVLLYDEYIVLYNDVIHTTYSKRGKYNNCVNSFIDTLLLPKNNDISYYINNMRDYNESRSKELSYHKSQYFDKDLTNLRHIKNECESIIKYIDKFVENLTYANYTE